MRSNMKRRIKTSRRYLRVVVLTLFILLVAATAISAQSDVCGQPITTDGDVPGVFEVNFRIPYYLWYVATNPYTTIWIKPTTKTYYNNLASGSIGWPYDSFFADNTGQARIAFIYDEGNQELIVRIPHYSRTYGNGRLERVEVESNKPVVWVNCTRDDLLPILGKPTCSDNTPTSPDNTPPSPDTPTSPPPQVLIMLVIVVMVELIALVAGGALVLHGRRKLIQAETEIWHLKCQIHESQERETQLRESRERETQIREHREPEAIGHIYDEWQPHDFITVPATVPQQHQ